MTEARVRRNQSYVVGWHNHEIYSVPASERGAIYVAVPSWWKRELEASPLLGAPAPWVSTYHSADELHASPHVRANLWAVAEPEFVVFAFFAFLDAAFQVLPYSRTPDARAYDDSERGSCQVDNEPARGRLVQLPARVCNVIDGMGVTWLVNGTHYSPELAVMALTRMRACDWSKSVAKYWYYDYRSGRAYGLGAGLDGQKNELVSNNTRQMRISYARTRTVSAFLLRVVLLLLSNM